MSLRAASLTLRPTKPQATPWPIMIFFNQSSERSETHITGPIQTGQDTPKGRAVFARRDGDTTHADSTVIAKSLWQAPALILGYKVRALCMD